MYLGLDIGGANLKAAGSDGHACLVPFEVWKNPFGLADALHKLIDTFPALELLAVTMTGELCDCFETKRQGVLAILDSLADAAGSTPCLIWRNDGQFIDAPAARRDPLPVASANWLALAMFAGRFAPQGSSVLIDIGSTTTDIIPIFNGKPVPQGRTDSERMRCGELVYTGVRRTPVCALLNGMGAAEVFATTLDAYLVLGLTPENPADLGTADGRPATKEYAHARLARMIGGDQETTSRDETTDLAQHVKSRQTQQLQEAVERAIERLTERPRCILLAGSGEFLAFPLFDVSRRLEKCATKKLSEVLSPTVSHAACAYALAVLASEQRQ